MALHACVHIHFNLYMWWTYMYITFSCIYESGNVHVYMCELTVIIILFLSLALSLSFSPSLQSAIAKEQELENKLASMQGVINAARELASDSMIVSVPHLV